jgi:hypothetical protein
MDLVTGVVLTVTAEDLPLFLHPAARPLLDHQAAALKARVDSVHLEQGTRRVTIVLTCSGAFDHGAFVSAIAGLLAPHGGTWNPVSPAPRARQVSFRGIPGPGRRCSECQGLDGHHRQGCSRHAQR